MQKLVTRAQYLCLLLSTAVFFLWVHSLKPVTCLVSPKQPYFLWPNTATGDATVYFKDGTSKPIETLWVGYAAWDDITAVKASIASIISKGSIPYIQSYSFGDNGLRGNYNLAVEFDRQLAIAIGSSFAFVNLETEWDDVVLTLFQTAEGTQSLIDRVNVYRNNAPNTIVVSSPGLWKSTSSYTFFSTIDATLNARAMLTHVVNIGDSTCSLRSDGTLWTSGATSLSSASMLLTDTITKNLKKMNDAWGTVSPMEWILADTGVTSCGWGESGQATILNEIVKNLDCLYLGGFRGFILRNSGPDNLAERAMGINNEGMFAFTTSPSSVTVLNNGLTRAKQLFVNNQAVNCVDSSSSTTFTITISSSSNNYWAQVEILPSSSVKNVTMACAGATSLLDTSAWDDSVFVKSLSTQCPPNNPITILINGNQKAEMKYTAGTSATTISTIPQYPSNNNTAINNGTTPGSSNGTIINNGTTTNGNGTIITNSTTNSNGTVINNGTTNGTVITPGASPSPIIQPNATSSTVKPIPPSASKSSSGSGNAYSSGNNNRNGTTVVINSAHNSRIFTMSMFVGYLLLVLQLLFHFN